MDAAAGPTVSLASFFFVPVAVVSWFAGSARGGALAVLAAAAVAAKAAGQEPAVVVLSSGFHAAAGVALAALVSGLNRAFSDTRTDAVTGLASEDVFKEVLGLELRRSRRYHRPFTVVGLDVDGFRAVNERFGHSVGDALLRSVASLLRRSVRATDLVCRLGDDDFVVLLPETGNEAAGGALRKIAGVLEAAAAKTPWAATFSLGAVTFAEAPETAQAVLERVEGVTLMAKQGEARLTRTCWAAEPAATPEAAATA